ncbi:MAG: hypothetical protein ACYCYM_14530 [Saccharofermentanales bacterium]
MNRFKLRQLILEHKMIEIDSFDMNLTHAFKVEKRFGAFIEHFYIFEKPAGFIKIDELEKIVCTQALASEEKFKLKAIRQRFVIFCIIWNECTLKDISEFIGHFNFLLSIYLPVVIDIKNGKIYHSEIPQNKLLAKGKAITDMMNALIEVFFLTGKIIKS